jgi:hypothetical protein
MPEPLTYPSELRPADSFLEVTTVRCSVPRNEDATLGDGVPASISERSDPDYAYEFMSYCGIRDIAIKHLHASGIKACSRIDEDFANVLNSYAPVRIRL